MGAHHTTLLVAIRALAYRLVKHVHEADGHEVIWQSHLDVAVYQREDVEEELKALCYSSDELEHFYHAKLERNRQAARREDDNEARGASSSFGVSPN